MPGRQLALLGVAGESVGVLAGAAGWRLSGEPAAQPDIPCPDVQPPAQREP